MAGHRQQTPKRPPRGEIAGAAAPLNTGRWAEPIGAVLRPSDLLWGGGPRVWRKVISDEKAATSLTQLLGAVEAIPWRIEPGGPSRRDKAAAEDITRQLEAIDFDAAYREMAHSDWYGYAVAEIVWRAGMERIEIEAIRSRAPERFRFAHDGGLRLITRTNPMGEALPDAKFWVARVPAEHGDRPHGPGAAQYCFWPVWLKRNGLRYWAAALERFAQPIPVIKYSGKAGDEEMDLMLETLERFAAGAGLVVKDGQEIELLEAKRRSGGDFLEFCSHMDQLIVEAVLLQTSTTEIGPWKGTAEVQKLVRDEKVTTLSRRIAKSFERGPMRWLTDWNFPGAAYPRLIREIELPEDLNERAAREDIIARMSGLRPTPKHVHEIYGGEWERAAPRPGEEAPASGDDPAFAAFTAREEVIAQAAARVAEGWEPLMTPLIEPVLDAAANVDGIKAFREHLPATAGRMDTDPVTDALHRQSFSAELSGRAGLEEEPADEDSDDDE